MFYEWYVAKLPKNRKGLIVETTIVANLINYTNLPTTEMTDQPDALRARYYQLLGPRGADPKYRESLPPITLSRAMYDAGVQTPGFREAVMQAHRRLKQHDADLRVTQDSGFSPRDRAAYQAVGQDSALSEA